MPRQRAPWWIYVVAASYVGFVALFPYEIFWGPFGLPGFEGGFRNGSMVVFAVHPDSAEARAGLEEGDRILAVNGQAIHSVRDWESTRANVEPGRPRHWEIDREGKRLGLTVVAHGASLADTFSTYFGLALSYNLFILTSTLLGLLIAFRRPRDPVALMGAWVLLTVAGTFGFPDGWAATWRHLPAVLSAFLWIPEISRFVVDAILLSFFLIFPRKVFHARWPWALIWAPALAFVPWRIEGVYDVVYRPWTSLSVPGWVFTAISLRSLVYILASVGVLLWSYRRLTDSNQLRRVRIVLAGMAISALGVVAWVALGSARSLSFWHRVVELLIYVMWLAFPVSFAFAILRHRLFDLGVMIRQGLQYALARGVLISLVPAMGVILVGDMLVHGNQPLIEILAARGWLYAGVGALALVAYSQRQNWQEALDRRFFREHYDAQHLLREIAEEVREAGTLGRAAPRVTGRIEAALHPAFAAIMVRPFGEANFHTWSSAPAGQGPPELPADSKLLALLRVLGKPLEVTLGETAWLQQQLPHSETDFLRQASVDLLVPITMTSGQDEALLALGVKRSEEPYSGEDQDLLAAIASNLALLERSAAPATALSVTMHQCPQCGACYDSSSTACAQDGAALSSVNLPRSLAGRYRLDRRCGRGGMGAVYEALDTALDRRVAVKVIRDELAGNAEAAERFRREARAAAGLSHPNVVTIFDFGVEAEKRAFLVMELLEGATLREELDRLTRLPPPRATAIMHGVCDAVAAGHARHLVHRDLKPENIFLAQSDAGEMVKVLDFGLAKLLPTATQETAETGPGALLGTVRYMSPEQLRGEELSKGWDLWALAVVSYEMLMGAHPFQATTVAEFHSAILAGRVTPVREHMASAPAVWQKFFDSALAPDPSVRPDSPARFISGLKRALS